MVFEADGAFDEIDGAVSKTLHEAAKVLAKLNVRASTSSSGETTVSISKEHKVEYQSVPVTAVSNNSYVTTHPKSIIRRRAKPRVIPSEVTTVSSEDNVPSTPELFPPANFIPAKKWASMHRRPELDIHSIPISTDPRSVVRKEHHRASMAPLVDVKHVKQGGRRNTCPDKEFPSADYNKGSRTPMVIVSPMMSHVPSTGRTRSTIPSEMTVPSSKSMSSSSGCSTGISGGRSSSNSTSLICDPMEFLSKDGRLKMLLQPVNYAPPNSADVSPPAIDGGSIEEDYGKMRKFESSFEWNGMRFHVIGLYNGKTLLTRKIRKVYVNGTPYHP